MHLSVGFTTKGAKEHVCNTGTITLLKYQWIYTTKTYFSHSPAAYKCITNIWSSNSISFTFSFHTCGWECAHVHAHVGFVLHWSVTKYFNKESDGHLNRLNNVNNKFKWRAGSTAVNTKNLHLCSEHPDSSISNPALHSSYYNSDTHTN